MSAFTDTTELDPSADPATRSPILVAGLVVLTVLVGIALWFFVVEPLLLGDAAEPTVAVTDTPDPVTDSVNESVEDDVAVDGSSAPELVTYEVVLDRDPFDPVVPRPEAEQAAALPDGMAELPEGELPVGGSPIVPDDGTIDPDGTDTGGGDGTTVPDGGAVAQPPVEPVGCTTAEDGAVCDGRTLSLIKISETADGKRVAIIQVGSTIHEVEKGEVFAATFRLLSLGQDHVTVSFGDDVVELRQGERVLK